MRSAIERGADEDAVDMIQSTPFHIAANCNNAEAIDVLVEAGANIDARASSDFTLDFTPLHAAITSSGIGLKALMALLKHGADINAQTINQETPLHWAVVKAGKQGTAKVVNLLLRSGADETILNIYGEAAADVVANGIEEEEQVAEDVDRVRANAPANRAWRRRGYLVLCRAHPDRMQLIQDISAANADTAQTSRSGARLGRTEASGTVDGRDDWAFGVARVLVLQEEGMFRTIVGYL